MLRKLIPFLVLAVVATTMEAQLPSDIQRFALAYLPYEPGSTVQVKTDYEGNTAAGPYVVVSIVRTSLAKKKDGDQLNLLYDPTTKMVAVGSVIPLAAKPTPVTLATLPAFVEQALPKILFEAFNTRLKTRWTASVMRPTGVIPIATKIFTGYGDQLAPSAVSADGRYYVLGGMWPLDRDPRAVRREILANGKVLWDPGNENAIVKIVEFSDFQCPGCKRNWDSIAKPVLGQFGKDVRHGLVTFPLTYHPWAFKAAVAGECVFKLWPDKLVPLKDEYYRLQEILTVDTVDQVATGFLLQKGLTEKTFSDCYMKDPAIDAVLDHMSLGQSLGVASTPTYYANGETLPFNEKDWWIKRLQAIIAAGGVPEKAAEIKVEPTPTPAATAVPAKPGAKGTNTPKPVNTPSNSSKQPKH